MATRLAAWCWRIATTLIATAIGAATIGAIAPADASATAVGYRRIVAAGGAHTCVLLATGKVRCWGLNSSGQLGNGGTASAPNPVLVAGLNGVTAIAAGASHSCALLFNGRVRCWGRNASGQLGNGGTANSPLPVPVTGLTGVRSITAGASHTCALLARGAVRCWGANGDGQLGNGTRIGSLVPVAVGGLTSAGPGSAATTVVAGSWHTCALLATGAPKCWGRNADGQLGNGTTTRFLVPVAVAALTRVTVLSTGATHSCALLATGLVRCWGRNADGQLGNGLTVGSALPVAVVGLSAARPTTIAAGRSHTCATLTNGETRCWGRNASGQLGTGDTAGSAIPRAVTGLVSGVDVATGRDQSCGLAATGAVSCWGNNANGQLGNGTTTGSSTPVPALSVGGATSGLMVDGGPHHTCAILATGTAKCWGNNVNGGLGNGTLNVVPNPIPVPVGSLTGLRSISAGGNPATTGNQNSCAVEASGTVWCWGDNLRGQLGTGQDRFALPRSSTPVQVVGITNAVAVSTEDWHACAALSNGTVKCWGNNSRGELGNGTTTESNLPVTVLSPTSGNPSAPLTGVVEVTTGYLHSCALLANGTVRCWGSNANTGNAAPGNSLTPVAVGGVSGATAIAAGDQHACVLLAAGGSMKCWGTNFAGQLGDPAYPNTSSAVARAVPGIAGVSAMAVGVQHTCVVLAENGSVRCWGGNTVGQLGNGTVLSSGGPVTVRGLNNAAMLTGVTRLTAGSYHTCAVLAVGGVVSCWGQNHYGQLGNGTISNATTPVKTNL